jgi:hypothetical protein
MTYQSDPNTNRRTNRTDETFYTTWIIRGGVGLAIIVAVFAFMSTGDNTGLDLPRLR